MTTGMTSGKGEVWTRSGLARSDCSAGNRLTWCDAKLVRRSSGSGTASVPAEMMVTFKEEVSRMLTPHASAIVPDPEYGLLRRNRERNLPDCCWRTSRQAMTST